MLLMVLGSIAISFGGLIICAVAMRAILELINKPRPEQTPSQPV